MINNKKILIITLIATILISALLIYYNFFYRPGYSEILARVERLISNTQEVSIKYLISYQSIINDRKIIGNGTANFTLYNKTISWNNSMSFLEGTIYDIKPQELINIMKMSELSEVMDYLPETPCYSLNAYTNQTLNYNLLMNDYSFTRIMACFDKKTGYPTQYTIVIIGMKNGVIISYNSMGLRSIEVVQKDFKPTNSSGL